MKNKNGGNANVGLNKGKGVNGGNNKNNKYLNKRKEEVYDEEDEENMGPSRRESEEVSGENSESNIEESEMTLANEIKNYKKLKMAKHELLKQELHK